VNGFLRVGRVDDVPPFEGRAVTVGAQRVAVFRTTEGFFAIGAVCPHAGGPLSDGIVADNCVTCPLHNRRFDLRTGAGIGGHPGVERHEVVELDGDLWLRVPAELDQAA
jgi:nitrite reductase (NADH) small subunit